MISSVPSSTSTPASSFYGNSNEFRLLKTLLDEIEDFAIISLDVSGRIETWNKGAEKIKGYAASEVLGQSFEILYPSNSRQDGLPQRLLNQANIEGRVYHEGWRARKDHSLFWGGVTITAMRNENGDLSGFCKITKDLTDHKKAEIVIENQIRQLRIKNRDLEQFAYITSHDLQEPLLTSMAFVELLRDEYSGMLDGTGKMYLDVLSQSAIRMRELINVVLDYSRIGRKAQLDTVDCMSVVDAVKHDLGSSIAKAGATLHYESLPHIVAFPLEIRQLFQNLISNAIKFRNSSRLPIITVSCKQQENHWQFMVNDNGIGIDPVFSDKIFNIFQRLHSTSEYEGLGIGLANCKKIVAIHGGVISVQSEPGLGSTFSFTIPFKIINGQYKEEV